MTGNERIQRITRYFATIGNLRAARFVAGEVDFLPCWGDEMNDRIAVELDAISGPLYLGLWFWEVG